MIFRFLLSLLFVTGLLNAKAMDSDTLNIPMDLDSVYAHYSEESKSELFEGYTIQLFSGTREGAFQVRSKILSLGAEQEARMIYKEPNFKIHIGSFPDAAAAERALVAWTEEFPNAFIVQTLVPWYPTGFEEDTETTQADAPETKPEAE